MLDDSIASVETVPSDGRVCNASFDAGAIYARRLELSGSPGPGVPKYESGSFCVCKFFVSGRIWTVFSTLGCDPIGLLLSRLCGPAFTVCFVFARAAGLRAADLWATGDFNVSSPLYTKRPSSEENLTENLCDLPSPPVGRRPLSITPTFASAVHFRFAVPREANRTEYDSAFVANFPGKASVLREKLVAFLDG